MQPTNEAAPLPSIAVLGGTGKEGKGLALRWARAGYRVIIGSRSIEKAQATANELMAMLGGAASVQGKDNLDAARQADIAVLTVLFEAHAETLLAVKPDLEGKLLIDVAV